MSRRGYSRDDVQTHREGFHGDALPAVNVKVYRSLRDAWRDFEREEQPDARFTLEWVDEHVSDDALDAIFWHVCEAEYEYLEGWATEGDSLFPADRVQLSREGRQGGWIVVDGLPELEEWDAVRIARWRRFERIARQIADGIPFQMLASIYLNDFERWADEQEDESGANAEIPVDRHFAERGRS
jgi:hypothetical protein